MTRYGLTGTWAQQSHRPGARRHIYWTERTSKCGQELVAETTDTSIRLCAACARSLAQLERGRGIRV